LNELWGIAKITGTCKHCGRVNNRELKVNRGWIDKNKSFTEPVAFGYMGDCPACGEVMGGNVEWPALIVIDEVAL
jgi:hypothetical protein